MRALVRVLLALGALLALALVALAALLPRLAGSDAVRARLGEAVRDATRRELRYGALDAGLFPPHLEVREASLSGDAEGPALAARRVELRLAILPLLARAVVVRSLRLEGASLRAERTEQGVRLVGEDLPEPPEPERPAEPAPEEHGEEGGFALAVQRVVLAGAALRLDDRTREPAPRLELHELEGEIAGTAPDAPVRADLRAALASGGRLALRGSGRARGPFDAELELEEVQLAPFAVYAGGAKLAARAGGTLRVAGEAAPAGSATLDLRLDAEDLELGELELRGPFALHAELAGEDLRAAAGPVSLDAGEGELRYRNALHKPPGVAATLSGTLRREEEGGAPALRLDDAALQLGGIGARGELEVAPRPRVRLDAPPFDAAALEALVPALAGRGLSGSLSLAGLDAAAEPLAVQGRVALDPLGLAGVAAEPLVLRGALEGTGDEIVGRGLRARLGAVEAPVDLALGPLGGAPRLRLATRLEDADSGALVAALGGDRDRLSGPLDLEADLAAPLAGPEPPLAGLAGDVSLRIAPGRLRKVSLLRAAFEAAGAAKAVSGDPEALRRHYGDEFESLSGSFRIRRGEAHTDDLRLVYQGYTAQLQGSIGLADRALDLHGSLTLDEDALGESASGRRTIPLASVTGTLDDPQVALTREALAGIAAAYATDPRRREKWERKLDERLGEGRGKDVLDALDQMLDSMKKPPAADAPSETP